MPLNNDRCRSTVDTGALAPLGAPARPRLSSEDIKHDLLRQGLISPGQSPNTSQELTDAIKSGHASGEMSDSVVEEITVEEVNDFYGDHSGDGSDLSYVLGLLVRVPASIKRARTWIVLEG